MLALFEYITIFSLTPVADVAQNAQPFFIVPNAVCGAPTEMINNGFFPWFQFLKVLLFA